MRWILLSVLLLGSGCSVDLSALLPAKSSTPTPMFILQSPTPAPTSQATRNVTVTPANLQTLVIWVPPQFDPGSGTPAGDQLRTRLASFESENKGYKVQVRVKAAGGAGGLLESLSATSAAAPTNLPSLVVLQRTDLEAAALKGLVLPLDGLSRAIDDVDWYPFARQLALIQGSAFGLPFAGDGLLLLYRPARLPTPPTDWAGLLKANLPLAFAAADNQSLVTLWLYLSAGGQVKDSQGRPTLQAGPLTQVLKLYDDGAKANLFPSMILQYQTDGQAWQAYHEQRTQLLITWGSRYLADIPADTSASRLPSLGNQPLTLATGWVWALSDAIPERQSIAARLAEYLVGSDFLARWSSAAGFLPTRPSALTAWPNQGLRALFSPVALSAQIRPSTDLLIALGPALQEATLKSLKGQGDPAQNAQAAVERLTASPSK